ncbi:MAG: hypothetical protein CMJ85_10270 [Planctomycetes bacterium]|nr:hypothetical protein [Planctomycetota bacterium]
MLVTILLLGMAGPSQDDAKVDKWVRDATRKHPLIRIQAAKRVGRAGAKGLEAVQRFVAKEGRGKLSTPLVRALGDMGVPAARTFLRELVEDDQFTWRPQALTSLSEKPEADECDLFEKYLQHRSWLMRRAALTGTARLAGDEPKQVIAALGDRDLRVRVHAAALLLESGKTGGLAQLVHGLDAEEVFFRDDLGYRVRLAASKALTKWAGKDYGYSPRQTRSERTRAVQEFAARVRKATGVVVPRPAAAKRPGYVLGYERRSCRDGDLYLRVDDKGKLWRGLFDPVVVTVSANRLAMVRQNARAITTKRRHGRIECDFVNFAGLGTDGAASTRCAPGAIPEALSQLETLWQEAIKKGKQ